ncbi:MAG: hypothetical protein JXK94_01370 [Deltaproteobacteria bacterium]|nr:hypothetical protein [Deltaproteobacteria bacterium]
MKALRVLLISLVALALAMPAMAMNVTTSGNMYQWFGYQNMMPSEQGDWTEDASEATFRYHTRARLYFKAEDDEKKVRGTYGFEMDLESGIEGDLGGDAAGNVETRFAYIDFELPFDPASRVYMGLMPVGAGSDWVFDDNAMGVKVARSMGPVTAGLAWVRASDDDGVDDGDDQWFDNDNADVFLLDLGFDINDNASMGAFIYYEDSNAADPIWLGIDGAMESGPFSGQFAAIYLTGDETDAVEYSAYLLFLEGTYSFGNNYVQLGWYWATGDDDAGDDENNQFQGLGNNASVTNTWTGSKAFFEALDLEAGGSDAYLSDAGLGANVAYLNFGHEFSEKADARVGLVWINYVEDDANGDSNVGWEVNGEFGYAISENLQFAIAAGYVLNGDVLDELDADNLYRITSQIKLSF